MRFGGRCAALLSGLHGGGTGSGWLHNRSANPAFRCTPQSVAAHNLYENSDPFHLIESGGTVDATAANYEAISDRAVRVTGARFIPAEKYTVKIEGAALAGYRSIVVAGIRDPLVLRQLDTFLSGLRAVLERKIADSMKLNRDDYTLQFRVYGANGTLGQAEPCPQVEGHEVGLIIDVVAASQSLAADILPIVWHSGLHHPIPEHQGLISNLAFHFRRRARTWVPFIAFARIMYGTWTIPANRFA